MPIVITGFEPLDLLEGMLRTVRQLEAGRAEVENQYARAVRPRGQPGVAAADRRGLRGLRPQVARHRPDPRERLPAARRSIATTTPSGASRSTTSRRSESTVCISGLILQGAEEAARLPGVRQGVHAADAAGRDDGLVRRGLRRLLRLRPASRGRPARRSESTESDAIGTVERQLRDPTTDGSPSDVEFSAPVRCRSRGTTRSCSGTAAAAG